MATKKQKQKIQTIVSSILIVFLILAVVTVGLIGWFSQGFTDFNVENWKNITTKETTETTESNEDLSPINVKFVNSSNLLLASSKAVQTTSGLWSRDIVATVLPEDATNKDVSWSIKWATSGTLANNDVNNYLKLNVSEQDSKQLNIVCLKAFPNNNITITCTTQDNNFTATCTVNYIGTPETLQIQNITSEVLKLVPGQTYTYDLKLNNKFNSVTNEYHPQYTIKYTGLGIVEYGYDGEDFEGGMDTYDLSVDSKYIADMHFNATIENNKLKIKVNKAFRRYSENDYTLGIAYNSPVPFNEMYFSITITDTNSNVTSNKINFVPMIQTKSVSLNNTTITF